MKFSTQYNINPYGYINRTNVTQKPVVTHPFAQKPDESDKKPKRKASSMLPLLSAGAIAAGLLLVGIAAKKKILPQSVKNFTKTFSETGVKTPNNTIHKAATNAVTAETSTTKTAAAAEKTVTNVWKDLQFTKASTMEEAKAYARDVLGIKSFNLENDLVTANWFNEGMTNLQNIYKGKFKIPDGVRFLSSAELSKGASMSIMRPANSKIAEFVINKDFLKDGESLEHIKEITALLEEKSALAFKDGKYLFGQVSRERFTPLFEELAALRNGTKTFEPIELNSLARGLDDYAYTCCYEHVNIEALENLFKDSEKLAVVKSKIPNFPSLAEIRKMSNDQWANLIDEVYKKTGISTDVAYGVHHFNKFDLMYHEGAHLMHEQLIPDKFFAYHNNAPKGEIRQNASKELLDFLKDSKKQEIAMRVSRYAQHSPLEFVADTHIGLCNGYKFPDEVMDLYKFYNGPIPSIA